MIKTTAKSPGRAVRAPQGYVAYMPDPLPPKVRWTPSLVRSLSDADLLLGKLAGEGRRLPNPHVLMRPFIRREAVLSSQIEGTQATLGELLAVEAGAEVERSPDDLREVANYVVALNHGMKTLPRLPISSRLIRQIHGKLMRNVRGDSATPGEFRRTQNWIGPPGCTLQNATFVPPPPQEMKRCIGDLEKFLHDRSLPPLIQIGLAHYQFEAIHPFLDGNGRVGRLLITLFLIEREILPQPLLYLSAFFESTRSDYYGLLRAVSERGVWNEWLEYFLNGVARQSEDALGRAQRMDALLRKWKKKVAGLPSKTPSLLVDLLGENPFCTPRGVAKRLGIAFTTAQRAIDRLVKEGITKPTTTARRDRVYCARSLLDILEEPARLSPR